MTQLGGRELISDFIASNQENAHEACPTYLAGQGGCFDGAWGIRFDNGGNQRFGFFFNPGDPFFSSSSTYSFNQWRHIALSRQSGTFRLFIDGVQQASGDSSASLNLYSVYCALSQSLRQSESILLKPRFSFGYNRIYLDIVMSYLTKRLQNIPSKELIAIFSKIAKTDEFKGWWKGASPKAIPSQCLCS